MMDRIWLGLAVVVACNCESGPDGGPAATPISNTSDAELLQRRMRAHHEAATYLQRAVVHGRLMDARTSAAWINANANPRTDELLTAAYQIEQARDLETIAALTGDLAAACGSCHQERGATPFIRMPPEPAAVPGLPAQMQRHEWAAARLWDGVIGPSDEAWYAGARAMGEATIDLAATTHAKPNEEVVALAERMHELAARAKNTNRLADRSVLYGEMLQTCASCHAIVRPRVIADR